MSTTAYPSHYAAKMHQVGNTWRIKTTQAVVIGPEPRLVLALRARRDVELLQMLVEFPAFGQDEYSGEQADSVLAEVPHVVGLRRLKPEGEPLVWGQEATGADEAHAPGQLRWHGDLVNLIEHNVNRHPCIFWAWRGRILVPKGVSLGVMVRATKATSCRVKMAGA